MKKSIIVFLLSIFTLCTVNAADILGKWKTIDDKTGEVKSIVEITKKDGKLYGIIVKLIDKDPNYDPICTECKDHLKGKKILGMQIVNGLTQKDGRWTGSDGIMDPDNGKYYDVKMWVDEKDSNKLNVRGYIAFFYRTQTWIREK